MPWLPEIQSIHNIFLNATFSLSPIPLRTSICVVFLFFFFFESVISSYTNQCLYSHPAFPVQPADITLLWEEGVWAIAENCDRVDQGRALWEQLLINTYLRLVKIWY